MHKYNFKQDGKVGKYSRFTPKCDIVTGKKTLKTLKPQILSRFGLTNLWFCEKCIKIFENILIFLTIRALQISI